VFLVRLSTRRLLVVVPILCMDALTKRPTLAELQGGDDFVVVAVKPKSKRYRLSYWFDAGVGLLLIVTALGYALTR
jgi:hypothetical protein